MPSDIINLSIAVGVIDTFAVVLRFIARWQSNAAFAADDWLMAASLVPLYGMIASSTLLATYGGLGTPIVVLSLDQITIFLKILMSAMIKYSLIITSVRISLLLLYQRMSTTKTFRRRSMVVGAACIAWFIAEIFANIFQYHPFSEAEFYMGITIANLFLDITVLSLPVYMVCGLRLSTRETCGLSATFLLGGLACVAGIMRVRSLADLCREDITMSITREYAWSQIEPAVAIICACCVTYKPLSTYLCNTVLPTLSGKRTSTSGPHEDWIDMANHTRSKV